MTKITPIEEARARALMRGLDNLNAGYDPLDPVQSARGLQVAGRLSQAVAEAYRVLGELDTRRVFARALGIVKEEEMR